MEKIIICLFTFLMSCSTKTIIDPSIEIVIEYPASYKYDLKNETYIVFFSEKAPLEIKFSLSEEERSKIINKYYDLGLNKYPKDWLIKDECMIMPKIYTILQVKDRDGVQKIQIDESCDDFYLSNFGKAKRVKRFIKFIREVVNEKPQIEKAPKSDFIYM